MRGGKKNAKKKRCSLLEGEIDISLILVVLVCGGELVLVGKIAGHEWKANGTGKWKGIVAVLERVVDGGQYEISIVFEPIPVEHHFSLLIDLLLMQT